MFRRSPRRHGDHRDHGESLEMKSHPPLSPGMNKITEAVIGAAIEVHRVLGPGLLESAYEECLSFELASRSLRFERQRSLPVHYKEVRLEAAYRIDLVVENQLILELKAVDRLLPIHEAQLLSYLRLTGLRVGLLLNFHTDALRHGLRRLIL